MDLIQTLSGQQIDGGSCGIDDHIAIAIRGQIKFCYWLDWPIYGHTHQKLTRKILKKHQSEFLKAKNKCATGLYCNCLQTMNHKWFFMIKLAYLKNKKIKYSITISIMELVLYYLLFFLYCGLK